MSGKLNCHNLFYGKTRMGNIIKRQTFSIDAVFQQNYFTILPCWCVLTSKKITLKIISNKCH